MLQVITIFGIGRVKRSNDSKYEEGDIVLSMGTQWGFIRLYAIISLYMDRN